MLLTVWFVDCLFTVVQVMILLVDYVLPESYFANNLRALSVDMAVFRDLLRITLPQLSAHLDLLQSQARDEASGEESGRMGVA